MQDKPLSVVASNRLVDVFCTISNELPECYRTMFEAFLNKDPVAVVAGFLEKGEDPFAIETIEFLNENFDELVTILEKGYAQDEQHAALIDAFTHRLTERLNELKAPRHQRKVA